MNAHLFSKEVQHFILANINNDLNKLILKGSPFDEVTIQEIAQQIQGIRVAQDKFPLLASPIFAFPQSINLQQTSSWQTATYKRDLFPSISSFADLTGGFGIDTISLSEKANENHYCEINRDLCEIAAHNLTQLGRTIQVCNINGLEFIQQKQFDLLFIDPSRRHSKKGRVVALEDCEPNLIEHWQNILEAGKQVLVKLSPLIDLDYLKNTLTHIKEIHILSVKNDVKEVLLLAEKQYNGQVKLFAGDINSSDETKTFSAEPLNSTSFAEEISAGDYLYEPYSVLLKANLQDAYAENFSLKKIARNSNFFVSQKLNQTDLAKIFRINHILPLKREKIRTVLSNNQVNAIARNFPLTPEQVLKRLKLKQGGNEFLICTTKDKKPICLLCERV